MNSEEEFYYSNSTDTKPKDVSKLKHIAGVCSSSVVNYNGTGAYFLDKIGDGIWRLEVMPDAIHIRDPFERASPKKEVTRIQWQANPMQIMLPDLGSGFSIKGLNEGNTYTFNVSVDSFQIQPGTYLLTKAGKNNSLDKKTIGSIGLDEFVAPKSCSAEIFLRHEPFAEVSAGKPFTIIAKIVGIDTGRVTLQISCLGGGGPGGLRNIPMIRKAASDYIADVPADMVAPGELNYRIILQKGNEFVVFPGNYKGNPFAWDNYYNETWKTFVAAENGRLEIFNPTFDRTVRIYPGFRRGFQSTYITSEKPGQLILRLSSTELTSEHIIGFQYFFGDKLQGRAGEANSFNKLMIRARTAETQAVKAKITLTNRDAISVSSFITLTNSFQDIEVPLNNLIPDSALLMPRPYPNFLSLKFKGAGSFTVFKLFDIEKIEITIGSDMPPAEFNRPYSMEVESIWFQKN
jgi:hypothetical protein